MERPWYLTQLLAAEEPHAYRAWLPTLRWHVAIHSFLYGVVITTCKSHAFSVLAKTERFICPVVPKSTKLQPNFLTYSKTIGLVSRKTFSGSALKITLVKLLLLVTRSRSFPHSGVCCCCEWGMLVPGHFSARRQQSWASNSSTLSQQ